MAAGAVKMSGAASEATSAMPATAATTTETHTCVFQLSTPLFVISTTSAHYALCRSLAIAGKTAGMTGTGTAAVNATVGMSIVGTTRHWTTAAAPMDVAQPRSSTAGRRPRVLPLLPGQPLTL